MMGAMNRAVFRLAPALFAAGCLAGGCSTYDVKLDSVSRANPPAADRTSYTIQNKNPAVATDSLRYQEATRRIKTALSSRGLWEAPNPSAADMIVELDYAIEPAHTIYHKVEVPVYVVADRGVGQMPGREFVGYENEARPVVVREKHLSISCRENAPAVEDRPASDLWRISVSIEDERTDLRECLPVLAAVVMDQLGKTSDGVTMRQVGQNDPAIAFIKKGL